MVISGSWTLTATGVVSGRVAWWTWAIEAAAIGVGLKVGKVWDRGTPSSRSMICLMIVKGMV